MLGQLSPDPKAEKLDVRRRESDSTRNGSDRGGTVTNGIADMCCSHGQLAIFRSWHERKVLPCLPCSGL